MPRYRVNTMAMSIGNGSLGFTRGSCIHNIFSWWSTVVDSDEGE